MLRLRGRQMSMTVFVDCLYYTHREVDCENGVETQQLESRR